MTREEAITILETLWNNPLFNDSHKEALNIAIEALEHPEKNVVAVVPCGDAISRQAVLDTLENMDRALDEDRTVENYKDLLRECYKVLPSVKPRSEWEHDHEILKACSDGASEMLNRVRAEIEQLTIAEGGDDYVRKMAELFSLKIKVLQIIDKYMAEGSKE